MLDEVLVRDVVATAALLADVVDDRRRGRLAVDGRPSRALSLSTFWSGNAGSAAMLLIVCVSVPETFCLSRVVP